MSAATVGSGCELGRNSDRDRCCGQTPAPWYEDHPIGLLKAPREDWNPSYNFSAKDHHPLVAGQPILNEEDAASIDAEYADRMRSLLSVDDMVRELHAVLEAAGEWDNTFVIFSSAHLARFASHRSLYYCPDWPAAARRPRPGRHGLRPSNLPAQVVADRL